MLDDTKNFQEFMRSNPSGSGDTDNDQDIIILDDDDFIQTTLNLLDKLPKSSLEGDGQMEDAASGSNTSVLIDLTRDFDLNDLFQMHANHASSSQSFPVSNHESSGKVSFKTESDSHVVKNEFDLKELNFNFGNCMEEILIDVDDNDKISQQLYSDHGRKSDTSEELVSSLADIDMPLNSTSEEAIDSASISSGAGSMSKRAYTCETCGKTFNKVYNYKRHMFSHKSRESNYRVKTKLFQVNQCSNCHRRIMDKSNFTKHVRICSSKLMKKGFEKAVGESSETMSELVQIDDAKPGEGMESPLGKKCKKAGFECELCRKVFNKKFNFHRHLRMHFLNEILNHQHDPIDTDEIKRSYLERNVNQMTIFECDKCHRSFNEKKQLTMHTQKWHLTEYACSLCPAKFGEKFEQMRHLHREHSLKFTFECSHCFRSFRFLSHYFQHRRTHLLAEEEESMASWTCDQCGKHFSKEFNLQRHVATVHANSDRSLFEDIDKVVSTEHIINKNGRMKYECNSFQRRLYEENKLNFHLNKVHLDN